MTLLNTSVAIEGYGWSLCIAPKFGAAVISCQYDGTDILRPAPSDWLANPNILQASHFPLAPYSNRIEKGSFEFEGQQYRLPPNSTIDANPIHGTAWQASWEVIEQSRASIKLSSKILERNSAWPWRHKIEHRISISERGLEFVLSNTNKDTKNMPSGLGFHPYFHVTNETKLQFQANHIWQSNMDKIPHSLRAIPDIHNFSEAKSISGVKVDHCYQDVALPAYFIHTEDQSKIRIDGSNNLRHAVVYLDEASSSACFEPVTHMTNALNWIANEIETDVKILRSGETQTAKMVLSIEYD